MHASEEAMIALEKQYQLEMNNCIENIAKLKEVQELNDVRAGQLKQIIEEERKKHEGLYEQIEIEKTKVNEAQEEKKELFKMM